jgi:LPXTG-motif cell wall-anchored protein
MVDGRFPLWRKATGVTGGTSPERLTTTAGGKNPMKRFAVAALAVGLPLLSVATAHADTNTVTITGVAWKDLNGDGIRQPDEPLLSGIKIENTVTDATGHYTLHNEPADGALLQASPRGIEGGKFVLTRPKQGDAATDSDFDWNDGWLTVHQKPVDGVIANVDAGFMPAKSDAKVKVTPLQSNPVHVGDDVTYQIDITNDDFPSYVGVRVVFPDGVTLDPYEGPSSFADPYGKTGLDIRFLRAQEPDTPRTRTVSAKVTRPIDGQVTAKLIDTGSDVNPLDDDAAAPLTTAAAQTTTTTTTDPAPTTTSPQPAPTSPQAQPVVKPAALANTGVDPVWPLVGGLVLLAGGIGTVLLARRRRA